MSSNLPEFNYLSEYNSGNYFHLHESIYENAHKNIYYKVNFDPITYLTLVDKINRIKETGMFFITYKTETANIFVAKLNYMIKLPIQVLCLESVFENPKDTKILRPEINNISLRKYKDNISVTINIDLTNFSKILDNIDHISSAINCTDDNNFLDIDSNHNDTNQFNKKKLCFL
ncbi:hypothetical protein qu_157 [Acanthamoeba polyphaga mimivirus]|nr:hypothetical protein HIRU_S817 [Hirudovirus strain Sangsue]QTF49052.1 hypothetical protein [Mimivirus reunion]WMV61495.1 hypothetical protein qu_157 [Mimivirus sp.]WMV62472.1 hypothetical protein qu_157 [Acanthamoeba polyphaga mimivirus]WMV63449.1 hypothetical protein qu_157 [Mimivirus sp.]